MTARDFAQTLELCERFGIEHTAIGRHRGGRLAGEGRSGSRSAPARWCAGRARHGPFDLALGHGSNDVTVAAALLRIPCSTTFDYEWATVQHTVNCRLAQAVVVPEAIPPERLARYGARRQAPAATRGSRRSTTSPTSSPTRRCSTSSGSTRAQPLVVVRTPPAVSLYHRFENDLFGAVLRRGCAATRPGGRAAAHARAARGAAAAGGFIVPERAIDAQSLIAFADLVDLRRRHDEPRGRRARHAGLHDASRAAWAPSTSG